MNGLSIAKYDEKANNVRETVLYEYENGNPFLFSDFEIFANAGHPVYIYNKEQGAILGESKAYIDEYKKVID